MNRIFVVFFVLLSPVAAWALDVASAGVISLDSMDTHSGISPSVEQVKIAQIDALEERASIFDNYSAEFQVVIRTTENGQSKEYSLSSQAIGFKQGYLKVSVSYGPVEVINFGLSPKDVVLKLHRDNEAYVGTLEEAQNGKGISQLLSSDLSGLKMLFPEAWDPKANCRFIRREKENTVIYVGVRDEKTVRPIKKIILKLENNESTIEKIIRYDEQGEVCGVIKYSNYEAMSIGDKQLLVPNAVMVQVSEKEIFFFTLKKDRLKFNLNEAKETDTRVFPSESNDIMKFSQMR